MSLILSGDSPSLSGTYQGGALISGTAQASTSGTSINFTNIPSWVTRITVMFNAVSTSGTSGIRVQLGTGATPTYLTTAYDANGVQVSTATPSQTTGTEGFITGMATSAAQSIWGSFVITQISNNVYTYTATFAGNLNICGWAAGGRSTSGSALTAIRVTTVGGTDTFDNGTINILYE